MDAVYHDKVVHGKQRGEACGAGDERPDLKKWLVRRVECMRGEVDVEMELFPAFSKCTLFINVLPPAEMKKDWPLRNGQRIRHLRTIRYIVVPN